MEDQKVWPPPLTNQALQNHLVAKQYFYVWVPLLAIGLGLALGVLDVYRSDSLVEWLTIGVAIILGFLQPKTSWLSVFILSLCLYIVHVVAISHGFKQPCVERDTDSALACWESLLPNGLGALVGAVAKVFEQYSEVGPMKNEHRH